MSSFLTPAQYHAIGATERACSSLSMAASLFVIGSYLGSNLFQTPINRLIFYATLGNVLTNIGTFVGRDGVVEGEGSSLCTFQAFFIQWFMAADPLWSFSMALNVYLTLFCRFHTPELRRLEWRYFLLSYGLPFPPALVLLFIRNAEQGRVYGPAVLWCWISPEWDYLRIAVFYGPVWVVLLVTFAIYIYAGRAVLASRRQLRRIESADQALSVTGPDNEELQNYTSQPAGVEFRRPQMTPTPDTERVGADGAGEVTEEAYSPDQGTPSGAEHTADCNLTPRGTNTVYEAQAAEAALHSQESSTSATTVTNDKKPGKRNVQSGASGGNPCSSDTGVEANSLLNPNPSATPSQSPAAQEPSAGLENEEALDISAPVQPGRHNVESIERSYPENTGRNDAIPPDVEATASSVSQSRSSVSWSTPKVRRQSSTDRHSAAYNYSKRAILFFISLLVTWIPATINRIYLLVNQRQPSFAIAYIAALVLPLQGFWNSVVYIATSYDAVKALFATTIESLRPTHIRTIAKKMAARIRHGFEIMRHLDLGRITRRLVGR